MYFSSILVASLIVGLSAAAPAPTSTAPACAANLISPLPHGKRCAINGTLTNPDAASAAFTGSLSFCAGTCLESSTCQSLSYNSASSSCQLFGKSLTGQGFSTKHLDEDVEYYAAGCFACDSSTTTTSTIASSTQPATSTTTNAAITTASTAPSSTYPTCLETSVSEKAPNGTPLTYTKYYNGTSFTHKTSSSPDYPAVSTNLFGFFPPNYPCAAISSCATVAAIADGIYDAFDLYLVSVPGSSSPVWECVALKSGDVDIGEWTVGNSSIVAAYGFAVGA